MKLLFAFYATFFIGCMAWLSQAYKPENLARYEPQKEWEYPIDDIQFQAIEDSVKKANLMLWK